MPHAGRSLNPGPPLSCLRPTLALASQGRPSLSGRGPNLASEPGCNAVMGLVPPQSISQDLSEAILETINNARAPSTRANYQQRWMFFSSWCQNRELDPVTCRVALVLLFLQSLLDLGRAASTLRVYTAAISVFHETVGDLSVGKPPMVSQFLKGVNHLRPGRSLRAPSWDLPLVLKSLTHMPHMNC